MIIGPEECVKNNLDKIDVGVITRSEGSRLSYKSCFDVFVLCKDHQKRPISSS